MKQKNIIIGVVALVLIVAIGAVIASGGKKSPSSSSSTGTTPTSNSPTVTDKTKETSTAVAATAVTIQNYMFSPMAIKVKVGDSVTWTNQDGVRHNVVADKASADAPNGPLIAKGETYSFTFKKAGTFTFHCMPHPYMHGTVIVE